MKSRFLIVATVMLALGTIQIHQTSPARGFQATSDRELQSQADQLLRDGQSQVQSNPSTALTLFNNALTIYRQIASRRGEASALHGSGDAYRLLLQHEQALEAYRAALSIRQE